MKNQFIIILSILITMSLFVQPSVAQDQATQIRESVDAEPVDNVSENFRTNFTEAVESYIAGKDALLESDFETSLTRFNDFIHKLENIGEHGLSGEGHMAWMESYSQLTEQASTLTSGNNIEDARKALHDLSEQLAIAVKKFGMDGEIYVQYCPMALNSSGAIWLSNREKIQNPYTPESMIGCGEVIEKTEI